MIAAFTSSEIAILKKLNISVLQYALYNHSLCFLVIDELHLIKEWQGFQSDYVQFDIL